MLVVQTPVYRGGVVPATIAARRAAFVGTLGVSVLPKFVLDAALRGHPDTKLRLRYLAGSSNAVFSSGKAPSDAHSATVDLGDGWTLRVFAAVPGGRISDDRDAIVVLIGGIVLSVLVGLFLLLAIRLNRQLARQARQSAHDALHDALTGLPNRELFSDRLERAILAAVGHRRRQHRHRLLPRARRGRRDDRPARRRRDVSGQGEPRRPRAL